MSWARLFEQQRIKLISAVVHADNLRLVVDDTGCTNGRHSVVGRGLADASREAAIVYKWPG